MLKWRGRASDSRLDRLCLCAQERLQNDGDKERVMLGTNTGNWREEESGAQECRGQDRR